MLQSCGEKSQMWYDVTRQLDGATPQAVQKMEIPFYPLPDPCSLIPGLEGVQRIDGGRCHLSA